MHEAIGGQTSLLWRHYTDHLTSCFRFPETQKPNRGGGLSARLGTENSGSARWVNLDTGPGLTTWSV